MSEKEYASLTNTELLRLLAKPEQEVLILILLELRNIKEAIHVVLDSGVYCKDR